MPCYLRSALSGSVLLVGLWSMSAAQEAPKNPGIPALQTRTAAPPAVAASSGQQVDEDFIRQQFGDGVSLIPGAKPYLRDVDGDGIDDLVIAAISKKPMLDAGEHNYRVIDPYYTFYGYGDPNLTTSFGSEDLQSKNRVILIIHGAGADGWRAEVPKAKFVVINMPFKSVSVRRLQVKKKLVINAIFSEETDSTAVDSVLFWDGKQYKYQPIGVSGAND
jgi:hypothetical protein